MPKTNHPVPSYKAFTAFNGLIAILGLFLFKHDKKTDLHKISYIKLIYHLLVLAGIVYLGYREVTHFFPRGDDQDIVFILVVYYPKTAGHLMTFLLILSYSITLPQSMKLLNSKFFSEAINKINRTQLRKSYSKQLFFFTVSTVLYIVTEFFSNGPKRIPFLDVIWANDFTVYNVACIAQYYLAMTSTLMLVQILNENLKKIGELSMSLNSEYQNKPKMKNSEEKNFQRTLRIFYMTVNDLEGVNENAIADTRADKELEILNKILAMRRFYQSIFKISLGLNDLTAMRIMILVLHHTIIIIINLYSILRDTMEFSYTNRPSFVSSFLKCLSLSLISILWIIIPATRLFHEIHTTSYEVQDIITKSPSPAIVDEMELFSLQLLQEKVSISPFGFFKVANKLLLHLLSLVTTYLVILLQFKVMTDDMKAKNLTLPHEKPDFFPRFGPPRGPRGHGGLFETDGPPDEPPPPPPDDDDNFFGDDHIPPEPHEPPPF